MRPKYKNDIFNLIKQSEFSPGDFNILNDDTKGFPVVEISYKETPFKFAIRNSLNSFEEFQYKFVQYAPKFPTSDYRPMLWGTFTQVQIGLKIWLNEHLKPFELDQFEPDFWSEYKNGQKNLDFKNIDFNDKSKFSSSEKKQVTLAINELKYLIEQNFSPSHDQLTLINERLDYLTASTDKLNKFDWKSLAFSTIIGIVTTLSLDTEKGKLLFELFIKVFSTIHLIGQ